MIISEKIKKELLNLQQNIFSILESNSLTDIQVESFLRNFEKTRYNILNEIKIYNNSTEFEYEKIKTIDDEYKSELAENVLKIYIPEVLPSYKNLNKTHTHKRILLNVAELTKQFANQFKSEVFIYIKVFDKILGWDVDNRYIKPISDALILSKVIQDDNITKMFYCVKGEFSEEPHTEVYVFDSKNMSKFLENCCT
jgi:Holliday junction resolvase RusA-like endonuclease